MDVGADLARATCEPCRGGVPPLAGAALDTYLAQVPHWTLQDGTRIERRVRFKDFAAALSFVDRAAALAEAENHHPDICFGWGYARVSLQTKAISGLHRNDFILAAKLEALIDV